MNMKKKIKKVLFILLILFIIIILYAKFVNSIVGVHINWDVELPYTTKILHYERTKVGLIGDGISYTIVKYNSSRNIKKLNNMTWEIDKNIGLENKINEMLDRIGVESINRIDFDKQYKYYVKTKNDFSALYLIYMEEEKLVYIIENIL